MIATPRDGSAASAALGIKRGLGDAVRDIVELTGLQAELFKADARESARRLVTPVVLLSAAGVVGLSTAPLALLLVADVLVEAASSPPWLALLIAVILGSVATAATAWAGWSMLRKPFGAFQRSLDELRCNIEWLKQTVARQATENADRR